MAMDIDLKLIYGQPLLGDQKRNDSIEIDWAYQHQSKQIGKFIWQPCLHQLRDADLIVVEHASKLLLNYLLFIKGLFTRTRVAYWGHGKNHSATSFNASSEQIKNLMAKRATWYFAYTHKSKEHLVEIGVSESRITDVNNAIDTRKLVEMRDAVSYETTEQLKSEMNIHGTNVCLFTGSMYKDRDLGFLLEVCQHIKTTISDFEMIFIGDGPDASMIREASERETYIHYVGTKFDEAKIPYHMLAKLMLVPASLGLGVLDSFALRTPIVTVDGKNHGPEFSYLDHDKNAIVLGNNCTSEQYASQVVNILQDERRRLMLVNEGDNALQNYSVENMAGRFAEGIFQALNANI